MPFLSFEEKKRERERELGRGRENREVEKEQEGANILELGSCLILVKLGIDLVRGSSRSKKSIVGWLFGGLTTKFGELKGKQRILTLIMVWSCNY